jgi:hypothetical protein
MGRGNPG